jgi:Rieske Fe-S protein
MPKKSDYTMSRREFVAGVVAVVGAAITICAGLPVIGYFVSPALKRQGGEEWITLGPMSAIKPGAPTPFTFSVMREVAWRRTRMNRTVYALSEDGRNVTVFSDACTHLSCKVHWDEARGAFICPCHDGVFDKQGNVVSGPPPEPLLHFQTRVEGEQLAILLEA